MNTRTLVVLGLAVLASPSFAFGQDEDDAAGTLSTSYDFALRSWQIEGFYDTIHRVYVTNSHGALSYGMQLDVVAALPRDKAVLFTDQSPPHAFDTGTFVAEKLFLRYQADEYGFEIGDLYKTAGRGFTIAMNRNVGIDIDTTILGGAGEIMLGNTRLQAFGGVSNPQSVSLTERNQLLVGPKDRIVGARVDSELGPATAGITAVRYEFPDKPQRSIIHRIVDVSDSIVFSADATVPEIAGVVDAYVELAGVRYNVTESFGTQPDRHLNGHALYTAVTSYLGDFTFQLDAKSYYEFEGMNVRSGLLRGPYEYSVTPTLEKENVITSNQAEAVDSRKISGGRLTARWTPGTLQYWATYANFLDMGHVLVLPFDTRNLNERIQHVYGGVTYRNKGILAQAVAGGRIESRLHEPDVIDSLFHFDADVLVPLGGQRSLESKVLAYKSRVWDPILNPSNQTVIDNFEVTVSFRPWTWAGLTLFWDNTTDANAAGLFGGTPGNVGDKNYVAGEIDVRPKPNSNVRLFVGAQKGGLKCSGGTCRVLPPFRGLRLEGALRF